MDGKVGLDGRECGEGKKAEDVMMVLTLWLLVRHGVSWYL